MSTNPPRPTPGGDNHSDRELWRPLDVARVLLAEPHAVTITYDAGPPRPPAFIHGVRPNFKFVQT
jgi:hypothetical protein